MAKLDLDFGIPAGPNARLADDLNSGFHKVQDSVNAVYDAYGDGSGGLAPFPPGLTPTGVTPGTYVTPSITINQFGQLTAASGQTSIASTLVYAGPASGSPDLPSFRALASSDILAVGNAAVQAQMISDLGAVIDYQTRAAATAATIPVAQTIVRIASRTTPVIGSVANYKRVGGQPSHPGFFQDATGAFFEINEIKLRPQMFGAVANGSTDDGAALVAWYATVSAQTAAGQKVTAELVGNFATSLSLAPVGQVTTHMDAIVTATTDISAFNTVKMWSGADSGVGCVFDIGLAQRSKFTGRCSVQHADITIGAGLAAIGAGTNIIVTPDGSVAIPNSPGQGGSGTGWDSFSTSNIGYFLYTPSLGAATPSNLGGNSNLASTGAQQSPVRMTNGTDYLPIAYVSGVDIVSSNRQIFLAANAGTPTSAPVYTDAVVGNWVYVADYVIPASTPFDVGTNYLINTFVSNAGKTYRSNASISSGGAAPVHSGSTNTDPSVTAWGAGVVLAQGVYRSNGGNFYWLQATAGAATSAAPVHTTNTPVNDGAGNFWAYAGPATLAQWTYIRPASYNVAGTGMFASDVFTAGCTNTILCSSTACDDSFFPLIRAADCRDSAILNNGGTITLGVMFVSPNASCAKFAGGNLSNLGKIAIQNYGKFTFRTIYIDGEWARGMLLANASQTTGMVKPDAFFISSTGPIVETQPDATTLQARLDFPSDVSTVTLSTSYLIVGGLSGGTNFTDGATLTASNGATLLVLSSVRLAAAATTVRVVYRLTTGSPPVNPNTVTDGTVSGTIATVTIANTLNSGVIGTNEVSPLPSSAGGVCIRQIEAWFYNKARSTVPYIINRSTSTSGSTGFNSQDSFLAKNGDQPIATLYRFSGGLLLPMDKDGYYNNGVSIAGGATQLLLENGRRQIHAFSAGTGTATLPTTTASAAVLSFRAAELDLRFTNSGLATAGYPFTVDGAHPAVVWEEPPLFPASGMNSVRLWDVDGQTWRGWTPRYATEVPITFGAAISINLYSGQNFAFTATSNFTLTFTNLIAGQKGNIFITQDATGSRLWTPDAAICRLAGGLAGNALSTVAGTIDIVEYTVRSASWVTLSLAKNLIA